MLQIDALIHREGAIRNLQHTHFPFLSVSRPLKNRLCLMCVLTMLAPAE